jgi:seryl-tRNA synthetase
MRAYRTYALIGLVVILIIGYAICSSGKSDETAGSEGGIGFIGSVSEIKGELVKIRMDIQELEADRRILSDKKTARLNNGDSTEDLDEEMQKVQERLKELEAREMELNDRLSNMRK